jgi:hypothetical protein
MPGNASLLLIAPGEAAPGSISPVAPVWSPVQRNTGNRGLALQSC